MLVLALCALALLSPLAAGRWPAGLLMHHWRWPLLVWLALAIQIAIISLGFAQEIAPLLHTLTYALALGFLVLNWRVPGVLIVGVGALLNGGTIALNGGVLPTSPEAVAAAGVDHGEGFKNTAILDDPVLPWLGDIFAWPAPMPLANTFSVGDVIIVLGVVVAAWSATQRLGKAQKPADSTQEVQDSTL